MLLERAAALLWGAGTLILLLGTGCYFTWKLRFLPWRRLIPALQDALSPSARHDAPGKLSPFSALMTSLAATIGTGNIVGVAAAMAAGGPGVLVWMELSALVGMATSLAECTLSAAGRGCGPMSVMRNRLGLPGSVLAVLFSLSAVGASLTVGSMAQSNAMAGALSDALHCSPAAAGIVTAALTWYVLRKGTQGAAAASVWLVPIMAVGFLAAGLAVIVQGRALLLPSLKTIFGCAFSLRPAAVGCLWTSLRYGVSRGVFSNEAGMGSAAIAAAAADSSDPTRQGYIMMTSVFLDTCVICTVMALVLCCSGVLEGVSPDADGAVLVVRAFSTLFGPLGGAFVAISVALFAFSSMLGWAFQGEIAFSFLTGGRWKSFYRCAFCLSALAGALQSAWVVFTLADIFCALMCLPNLTCLLILSPEVIRMLRQSAAKT